LVKFGKFADNLRKLFGKTEKKFGKALKVEEKFEIE